MYSRTYTVYTHACMHAYISFIFISYISHVVSLIFRFIGISFLLSCPFNLMFHFVLNIFKCIIHIAWSVHFIRNSSKIIIGTILFCWNYRVQSSTFMCISKHFHGNGYIDWSMQFSLFLFLHKDIASLLKHRHLDHELCTNSSSSMKKKTVSTVQKRKYEQI